MSRLFLFLFIESVIRKKYDYKKSKVNNGTQTRRFPPRPIPGPIHYDNTSAFRGTSLTKPYFLQLCGYVSTSNLIWEREHSRNN